MRRILISVAILQASLIWSADIPTSSSDAGTVVLVQSKVEPENSRSVTGRSLIRTLMGGALGSSLTEGDRLTMEQTTQQTLEVARIGQVVHWSNSKTGNSGTVTVTSTTGRLCRQYFQTITVSGRTDSALGVACRQPDGSWKISG